MSPVELSIVTPVYQAEGFIDEFYRRMATAAAQLTPNYEIIFVNDGSSDKSLERLVALHQMDPRVVVIDLSRNFGQPNALHTGLAYATGELVFPIDDDLEEDPEWLLTFHKVLQEQQVDVVFGVQQLRKGKFFERFCGQAFYWLAQYVFRIECTPDLVTSRLMTRRYVNALLAHKEHNFEISIIGHRIGFKRATVSVNKRSNDISSYSFWKRVQYFENYVTSGSSIPLHWILVTGKLSFLIALLLFLGLGGYYDALVYRKMLLVSVWLIGGLILTALGILGIYAAKIFEQVKGRPFAVVREVWPVDRMNTGPIQ